MEQYNKVKAVLEWAYGELDSEIHDLWKTGDYREDALFADLTEMGQMLITIEDILPDVEKSRWGITQRVLNLIRENKEVTYEALENAEIWR